VIIFKPVGGAFLKRRKKIYGGKVKMRHRRPFKQGQVLGVGSTRGGEGGPTAEGKVSSLRTKERTDWGFESIPGRWDIEGSGTFPPRGTRRSWSFWKSRGINSPG